MKKIFIAFILCILALAVNANTITRNGVYVTLSPESYRSVSTTGYGNAICARFSLSSNESVRVHIVVEDRNGEEVVNKWITLTPNQNGEATEWISVPFAGNNYIATLVQH